MENNEDKQVLDIFGMIRQVNVQRIDEMLSDNMELQDLMLRNAEFMRLRNLEFFEVKKKFVEEKRELEILEAEKMRKLTPDENKNDASRKAALVLDPSCKAQREYLQNIELEMEKIEQDLWALRHLESNFKMIAELRIVELKKLG